MSDLEDLEAIAAGSAYGFRALEAYSGRGTANKKPYGETCAKGHARDGTNIIYRKRRGRVELRCRVCQQETASKYNSARSMLRASSKQEPST